MSTALDGIAFLLVSCGVFAAAAVLAFAITAVIRFFQVRKEKR